MRHIIFTAYWSVPRDPDESYKKGQVVLKKPASIAFLNSLQAPCRLATDAEIKAYNSKPAPKTKAETPPKTTAQSAPKSETTKKKSGASSQAGQASQSKTASLSEKAESQPSESATLSK